MVKSEVRTFCLMLTLSKVVSGPVLADRASFSSSVLSFVVRNSRFPVLIKYRIIPCDPISQVKLGNQMFLVTYKLRCESYSSESISVSIIC